MELENLVFSLREGMEIAFPEIEKFVVRKEKGNVAGKNGERLLVDGFAFAVLSPKLSGYFPQPRHFPMPYQLFLHFSDGFWRAFGVAHPMRYNNSHCPLCGKIGHWCEAFSGLEGDFAKALLVKGKHRLKTSLKIRPRDF